MMKNFAADDYPDNYEERRSNPLVTDVFESVSDVPKADGINYPLEDVNVAVQDIINLFKATLETVGRSLSKQQQDSFLPRENSDAVDVGSSENQETNSELLPEEETRNKEGDGIPKNISIAAHDFLMKLKILVDYIEKRINVSPTQQQEDDRELRHAVRSSRKIEMDIKLLGDVLAVQRTEHKKSLDKLNEELNKCENLSDKRAEGIRNDIRKMVNESEAKMASFSAESMARQEILRTEIEIVEIRLKNIRQNNILGEKELRYKRSRVENELSNSLTKYDTEIGGRRKDMENFSEEYQLLNTQRKMLEEDVMINLRALHNDLQKEKAEALQKILNEKVHQFVRNRAAKIIQKSWRAYWERHCAKKKKKSRKK